MYNNFLTFSYIKILNMYIYILHKKYKTKKCYKKYIRIYKKKYIIFKVNNI